jgi:hypothetical protein
MRERRLFTMSEKYRAFYERQFALLAEKDHVRLVDEQYHPDAKLININLPHVIEGADALKDHFRDYLVQNGFIKLIMTDKYIETDDSFMFEATVETASGIARVYDVFMMRDGRATHHFSGLISFIPKVD